MKGFMRNEEIKRLQQIYLDKKVAITKRLDDFRDLWRKASEDELLAELAFCIFTPQSKARMCDSSVKALVAKGFLTGGNFSEVRENLKGVRFPNNKTKFFLSARDALTSQGRIQVRKVILPEDIFRTRDNLVRDIKGLGYKEASHFLRNIGMGESLAILDVHILRNMLNLGLINENKAVASRKRYFELECVLKDFCEKVKIPLAHMDILLWSKETGEIFK